MKNIKENEFTDFLNYLELRIVYSKFQKRKLKKERNAPMSSDDALKFVDLEMNYLKTLALYDSNIKEKYDEIIEQIILTNDY